MRYILMRSILIGSFLLVRISFIIGLSTEGLRGYGDFVHFYRLASMGWSFSDYWVEFPSIFPFLFSLICRLAGGQEYISHTLLVLYRLWLRQRASWPSLTSSTMLMKLNSQNDEPGAGDLLSVTAGMELAVGPLSDTSYHLYCDEKSCNHVTGAPDTGKLKRMVGVALARPNLEFMGHDSGSGFVTDRGDQPALYLDQAAG